MLLYTKCCTFQHRLTQLDWLEAQVHEKDVLKCFMIPRGEPCVMTASLTLMQKSFAILSDSGTKQYYSTSRSTHIG